MNKDEGDVPHVEQTTPLTGIAWGIVALSFGALIIFLAASGVQVGEIYTPPWVGFAGGLLFASLGSAMLYYGIRNWRHPEYIKQELDEEKFTVARWLLSGIAATCFGILASWLAFGSGERKFEGTLTEEWQGRLAFGIGALIIDTLAAAVWLSGINQLTGNFLKRMLTKYLAFMRRSIAVTFEYRAGTLIWMITNIMPLVMLAVWYALAEDGPIGSYSQADFVAYYLLITFLRQMTAVWVIHELDYQIRHGQLSSKLLHPINPIHEFMSDNLADKIFRLVILIPLAVVAFIIFPNVHYDITPVTLALALVALAAAWAMRFLSQYTVALFSFWVSQAETLHEIWYATWLLIGGMVAPIELFPAPIAAVAKWLPFRFMLSFPAEIMLGRLTTQDLLFGLGATAFWLALMIVTYRFVWRRGLRQFSAYGA